jgi:predicted RNase H-like HicB family nuclease
LLAHELVLSSLVESTASYHAESCVDEFERARRYALGIESQREVEFVFEPEAEGGYRVYAPELPGLHTQGEDLEEATENAREALALYVDRDDFRRLL